MSYRSDPSGTCPERAETASAPPLRSPKAPARPRRVRIIPGPPMPAPAVGPVINARPVQDADDL